ncbi:BON domain-containing protein [Micromonospora sagamiensis]|uniref:Osmotically-inducible protein OsmY n=1 Tax=Micromonospora sagamiensis TaxID=47875 RepID=A0A562WCP1_9ACTN|nr:BON domain-containing protein [Micromonospora sagamiensis]TWJ27885.1 osmotically-inducible protein OsmY [Micromonospora sagamiensis]BCL13226.1 ornithine aminotransferase [Micromonospora sagamiensis]
MGSATITRTDQDIQADVLDELTWEPRVQPHEIGVTVTEGVVTLTGWVDGYAKKWAAERAAHRVARVRAVANDLTVRLPTSARRTDQEIAIAAVRALEWDAFVPVEELDVTVADGWVTLRGQVEWEYQRRAAERAVGRLTGVRGVSDGIAVRPRTTPPGPEVAAGILRALERGVAADTARVSVDVSGDTVVLDGVVRSTAQREDAERAAWSAPGVTEVHNRLVVRTTPAG